MAFEDNREDIKIIYKEIEMAGNSVHELRNDMVSKESINFLLEKIKE